MKTEIALIRSSYSPYGGVETLTLDIINELLKTGIKITLITQPSQKWPVLHDHIHIVPAGINYGHRLWQTWYFNHCVNSYLADHSFDCILSLDRVSQFTHLHCGGIHKAFLQVQNEHSTASERILRKASLFHHYLLNLEKKGFSNPKLKKVQCCSQMLKNEVQHHYHVNPDKIQVIYNGIDRDKIDIAFEQRDTTAKELTTKHQINPEWNCLLFLGSGFSRKGLDIAIKGLLSLPSSYHLLVIGKGAYKQYLRLATQLNLHFRVHFFGPQANGWKYASICKASVLPSRYEPFGIAAAEAQAMGIPVLVSDRSGYAELIKPGKTGIILNSPMTDTNIQTAFTQLCQLIEYPEMSPDQIRNDIQELNNAVFSKKLITEFLELQE